MTKIASRERGSGKVLICLHGYGGSVLHWEKITEELSKVFKVVVPNLSHLFMGRDLFPFTKQIDLIADFIKENYFSGSNYKQEPIYLAGISYGGALAWGVTSRYPELVDKVVFINPMPPFAVKYFGIASLKLFFKIPIPVQGIYLFLASPFGKYFLKQAGSVFRNLQGDFEEQRIESLTGRKLQFVSYILWKFAWILRAEEWAYWEVKLKEWNRDCLLIYDRKDPLFNSDFYDSFAKILASTNVVTTQDAGHISIIQQPKLIAGAMREYLLRDHYEEAQGYT